MRFPARSSVLCIACMTIVAACSGAAGPTTSPSPPPPASPTAAPTPAASLPASSSPAATQASAARTFRVTSPFPVTFDVAINDEWSLYAMDGCCTLLGHRQFLPPGLVMFSAWTVDALYDDPCKHVIGPAIGPGVDALVEAFRRVPALGAGTPSQVTLDGRSATHLALEPADAVDPSECVNREFAMWAFNGEETRYVPPGYRDVVDELWILEVDGTRIVIDGSLSAATDADREELAAMIRSVRFR